MVKVNTFNIKYFLKKLRENLILPEWCAKLGVPVCDVDTHGSSDTIDMSRVKPHTVETKQQTESIKLKKNR